MRWFLCVCALVSPIAALASADTYPAANGDIVITPIIHGSVQIEHRGTVIQVDPWSAGDLATAKPADLVLITDDPAHHLDVAAIKRLRKPGAPVVMPASGRSQVPDGTVLPNGASISVAGVQVESIAAYDLTPGAPEHPKGTANGYVVTLGGRRLYIAGVTQCVPELLAVRNVDVVFMPMNIPPDRMAPKEAADCTRRLAPKVVYLYHYDQTYAARIANPNAPAQRLSGDMTIAQSLQAFRAAMAGSAIEVREGSFYPQRPR